MSAPLTPSIELPSDITLITPAWGDEYIRVFSEIVSRSLLAPANLPAISERFRLTYHFYTDDEANPHFKSATFSRIRDLVDVQFHNVRDLIVDNKYTTMGAAYNDGVRRAAEQRSGIIFLNADMIYSDGSFANLGRLIERGKRCVEIEGFRVDKKALEHVLTCTYTDFFTIPSASLVRIGLKYMHPISTCHFWEQDGPFMPFHTYWRARTGVLARASHIYPLYLWPRSWDGLAAEKSIDWDLVDRAGLAADEKHIVQNSEEIFSVELSDSSYWIDPTHPQGASINSMRQFIGQHCLPEHIERLRQPIQFRTDPGDRWGWAWAEFKSWLWFKAVAERSNLSAIVLGTLTPRRRQIANALALFRAWATGRLTLAASRLSAITRTSSMAAARPRRTVAILSELVAVTVRRYRTRGIVGVLQGIGRQLSLRMRVLGNNYQTVAILSELATVTVRRYRTRGIVGVLQGAGRQLSLRMPLLRVLGNKYQQEGAIGVMRGVKRQVRLRFHKGL
ncbi:MULTISPECIES: hypothetical protein [unclassified Bradyrhizobium]|uniref:hypothetical protein n=1 Tax=unclassified Bradyrhizobium TaxID=2631580 RepID=UPI0028E31E4F|nr:MULTISPECIES: hypothetical protein [unclassified Bradyrhizobium]